MKITALVLTRPGDELIPWCIKRAREWADEVVVGCCGADTGFELADTFKRFHPDLIDAYGFAYTRNRLIELCTGDWIATVDTDELYTGPIREELEAAGDALGVMVERLVPSVQLGSVEQDGGWQHCGPQWKFFRRRDDIRYGGLVHEEPHVGEEHIHAHAHASDRIKCLHYGPGLKTHQQHRVNGQRLYVELLCRGYDIPALRAKVHPWWYDQIDDGSRTIQAAYWEHRGVQNLHQTQCNPYATHVPIVCQLLREKKPKDAIEFGCGVNSTPLLSAACDLESYDNDSRWAYMLKGFGTKYVANYLDIQLRDVDLLFVDGLPDTRLPMLRRWKDHAKYIVCHDTEDPLYRHGEVLPDFKYKYTDMRLVPWTTVVSNHVDLSFLGGGIQEYVPVVEVR